MARSGGFVMSKLRLLVAMAIFVFCSSTLTSSAAYKYIPQPDLKSCEKNHRNYLSGPLHKALATTGGRSFCAPATSWGAGWGKATVGEAIADAMYGCHYAAKKDKHSGTCKIIEAK